MVAWWSALSLFIKDQLPEAEAWIKHVKYKEPEQQRDFMIKYVQGRVEVGGGKDVHAVYEVNGAEETDTAIQNCLMWNWNPGCQGGMTYLIYSLQSTTGSHPNN